MANWAQWPLALGLGPISMPDSNRSTGYLCLCIIQMRPSLFQGQLGPGPLALWPRATAAKSTIPSKEPDPSPRTSP